MKIDSDGIASALKRVSSMNKICKKCGIEKDVSEFYKHKQCKGGISNKCKKCAAKYSAEWKAKNRDKVLTQRRQNYAEKYKDIHAQKEKERLEKFPIKVQAERLRDGISTRSKKNNIPKDAVLSKKSFFIEWLDRQPNCECCGKPFHIGPKKTGQKSDLSPSIDRFDPNKGYTVDNIKLICWRCNNIKRNYNQQDLRMVANWMDEADV